jgi:UDP-3-O-[3-hydroxymyristoyl] glucosamine N-acyltransferase
MILVERPNLAIYKVLSALQPKRYYPAVGIHPTAIIDPSCEIGDEVALGPYVVIGPKTKIGARTKIMAGTVIGGEVVIGQDCLIHPNCVIADYVIIGNRVILQQGAGLGSDGFGYVTEQPSNMELRLAGVKELSLAPNPLLKIPQIGTVIIEDDVEIGSNTTIDRATIGATKICQGAKIDNLVMVAHNCTIGREVILVAQVGVAGSCLVEDRAILAGQVGVKDHITIGRDAILEGQAGVMRDVEPEDVQVGAPAIPVREFMTQVALNKKLPKLFDQFKAMQKKVAELEKELEQLVDCSNA